MARIQVIVNEKERQTFRQLAAKEGVSLSAWLRRLALQKLEETAAGERIKSPAELERFFRDCERRNKAKGREPDWEDHLAVIDRSRASGRSGT